MSFDYSGDSMIFSHDGPMTLMERLGYVKQLVFSRTRLEFRLLWNKIFQRQDEELSWLLNPYGNQREATMMASFNKNVDDSYQSGREKVTIHSRGVAKKGNSRRRKQDERTIGEKAIDIARYMGMGVYMTSASFPSPFIPVNDHNLMRYDEVNYNIKIW